MSGCHGAPCGRPAKRELNRDVVGHTVRILRDIENKAGDYFPQGLLMRVSGTYRGRFTLVSFMPPTPAQQARGTIKPSVSKVRRNDFEIVTAPPTKTS